MLPSPAGVNSLSPGTGARNYDQAVAICEKANLEDFGLTPAEAADIVASSIALSIREDAHRDRVTADIERKLSR